MIFKNQKGLVKRMAGVAKMQALNNATPESLMTTANLYQVIGQIYVRTAPLQSTQTKGQDDYNTGLAYWYAGNELEQELKRWKPEL